MFEILTIINSIFILLIIILAFNYKVYFNKTIFFNFLYSINIYICYKSKLLLNICIPISNYHKLSTLDNKLFRIVSIHAGYKGNSYCSREIELIDYYKLHKKELDKILRGQS